jgi:hypothetical protein
MSTRRAVVAISVLLLAAGLAVLPAWADSQVRIVRLSLVNGPVQIDRATGQGFEKAISNMPITQGMRLRTDGNSRAEVEFEDGTTLRMIPGAEVEFPQLALRSDGGRVSLVRVETGTVYFNVRHKRDDDFRLAFSTQEIALDRSVRFRVDLNGGEAQIAVFQGEMMLKGPVESAKIKKNETLTLDLGDGSKYELAKGIAPMDSDSWDANRVKYLDYYASANYGRSPYSYGRSDLNYYGSWAYVRGYGDVWRPFGAGYGWDPFGNGYWSYYPGWGYTFVSGYPWGWSPYRYGSWVFVNSVGWCWRPGGWNNWSVVTPVYNAPPTYVPPQPPVVAPGGGTPAPTVIVTRGPGRKTPDPDGFLGGPAGDAPWRPAGGSISRMPGGPASAAVPGTPAATGQVVTERPRGRSVPGPNGPVMRSRLPDPDSAFRGAAREPGFHRYDRVDRVEGARGPAYRGAGPSSSPAAAPRISAPAAPPPPRMSAPSPAPHPVSRGETKEIPK